jgi:general secretion pathway protein D
VKSSSKLRSLAALYCVAALLSPSLQARTKKGDRFLKLGEKAEAKQDYDSALNYYEQALEEDSREPAYVIAGQRMHAKASDQHLAQGKQLLKAQKLDQALVQFQKALLTDPSSQIALQEISETTQMLKERQKLPEGTPILTPAERSRQELERRINSLQAPPLLRPINNQISSLKMNNQTARVLYESVGKLAGINVLFDPAGIDTLGGTKNFNLDLNNVTLDEALSYVALVTHTFWKAISRNAIFVTQESDQKRQEYQDEVVRVFYIQNASTPNEFTEIFNGVRTGAKLSTGIFQVASQNAIIARGSADTMSIVEKLVHDLDRPKAEVIVDVMVMEVAKDKVMNLGASLGGVGGLNQAITYNPRNSVTLNGTSSTPASGTTPAATTGSTSIALSQIGKVSTGDYAISLPSALLTATLSDSNTRLLQRPQVRVTDGGKASLKIGQKIPYVSGSLNSAVATPGSIPYATTQFQQVDVGVLIDLEPHVNGVDEVSMHIKVEISNVPSYTTIAGVQQPIIAQKVNEANIRMKDGEVSLLGGLSSENDINTVGGIPGIANVPLLGYLFGSRDKEAHKDDIIIALIPHIIRAPNVDSGSEGILAGSERVVRVDRRAEASVVPALTVPVSSPVPVSQTPPAPVPAVPVPVVPAPGVSPATPPRRNQ